MCHRTGSLQFSVSHLSSDTAWGCSIPVKKAQVASPLESTLDNFLLCCKQTDTCHRISDAWLHTSCVLKRSHSRGILLLALGYRDPTQKAYWYLLWDRYTSHTSIHCTHSRGILIFAVGLLPISLVHSLCPLKRHTDICCGTATYIASPFIVPTQEAYWYLLWDCCLYC